MIFLPEKKFAFYFLLPSIFYLLLSSCIHTSLEAQQSQPINLINADELEYSELGGIKLRKLTGHVQLQQNDVTMFCDQANQYLEQNLIDATGNVRIRQSDTINIYGNS